jgi:type II secretory ATPase GspE/PulE/Tfp pilus assembly ATPase PilB-like protein
MVDRSETITSLLNEKTASLLFKEAYSLRENGLLTVINGVTSLEEVMRVTAERGGDE